MGYLRMSGEYEQFAAYNNNCLAIIADEAHKQNGIFYATLIKDDGQAVRMVDYLVAQGV